jgi:hypothetical protein
MARKKAYKNKNVKSELQVQQEIEAIKASMLKHSVGYPKTYNGVFLKIVQFDDHTCRCMAQFPDCIYPKLWISPNKITREDVKNFIAEYDECMLEIYRETITRTDGSIPTDDELRELGNQALQYNFENPKILRVAYDKPSQEHINKELIKELSNIKTN